MIKLYKKLFIYLYRKKIFRIFLSRFFRYKEPDKWVFVVGCYNSGTTLLARIIGAHSEVKSLEVEGVSITDELRSPEEFGWTRMWSKCLKKIELQDDSDRDKASRIKKDWMPFFDMESSVFLEKSISNVPRMNWLDKHFNESFFIGIVRDPVAVAEGIRRKAKPSFPVDQKIEKYSLEMTASQWLDSIDIMEKNGERVKHYMLIRYEDLVQKPEEVITKIWTFLKLRNDTVNFDDSDLTINNFSEIIKNMNERSYRSLSDMEIKEIRELTNEYLEKYSYQ